MASTVPQQKPPSHSCLREAFFSAGVSWGRSFFVPFITAMTTSRASTAIKYRVPLKVNAPMASAQTSWATKAVPQIKAARMGSTTWRI